jgi:hypothetical protein
MPYFWFIAIALFLFMAGVGLYQPVQQRFKAQKFKRNALRFLTPRVWFGAEGVYHEALGYTSLENLEKVSDHTRSVKTIKFTTIVDGGNESDYFYPVSFTVPSGYEKQASQLVRRYRQERLRALAGDSDS